MINCNLTDEQIKAIINNAPSGSQFYTDGYDVKYRKIVGDKYYGYLEEAKGWVETCDKELSQERIDKGWWLANLIVALEWRATQTKEVEWVNGDKCVHDGSDYTFVGMTPTFNSESCIIFNPSSGARHVCVRNISKPETEAERVEREREEFKVEICKDLGIDAVGCNTACIINKLYELGYRKES